MTCPCGERCSNQRIQRREWLSRSLEKVLTDSRGFGVRTTHHISAGTSVFITSLPALTGKVLFFVTFFVCLYLCGYVWLFMADDIGTHLCQC